MKKRRVKKRMGKLVENPDNQPHETVTEDSQQMERADEVLDDDDSRPLDLSENGKEHTDQPLGEEVAEELTEDEAALRREISEILEIPSDPSSITDEAKAADAVDDAAIIVQRFEQELAVLRSKLEVVTKDRDDLKDRYLRTAAEMDNFRKRTERDFDSRLQFAFAELVRDLLPVLDDLQLSLNSTDDPKDYDSLLGGAKLIHEKFLKVLESHGVKAMHAADQEFDPNLHEALTQMEAEGKPAGIVLQEHQKGYMLNDKVLRPAKVIVSK